MFLRQSVAIYPQTLTYKNNKENDHYCNSIFCLPAVGGLRATDLRISPPVVQRGNDTTLACLYELTDAPLYSVKWYRGRHEFYRYSPTENPTTKIFPFAGINVDVST